MSTERELRTIQGDRLFEVIVLKGFEEIDRIERLEEMEEKLKSGMTKEEIDEISERAKKVLENRRNKNLLQRGK